LDPRAFPAFPKSSFFIQKKQVFHLQRHLAPFGISAFVAHADIKPTKQWQIEIEKALATMDALAALLTEKFRDSDWCDQEVGVAVGRDVLVIPITVEALPYGFIAKYQAIQGKGKYPADLALSIFQAIATNPITSDRMAEVIVGLILSASSADEANQKLQLLHTVDPLSDRHFRHLRDNILSNRVLHETGHFFFRDLNKL
jgi:hypothetical protein